MLKSGLSVGFLFALAGSAYGTDLPNFSRYSIVNDRYSFSSGIGYSWIKADEIVYENGNRVSHLFWASQVPVVTGELRFKPAHNLTMHMRAKVGFAGTSKMDDYDWAGDYFRSYQFDDWTHHSSHKSVSLDRYIAADVAVGYDFDINDAHTANLNGGFKYSNIRWTAYGGDFNYSIYGFRDFQITLPDRTKGITYEQRFPALFLGGHWSADFGKLSFSALGRVGTTVSAKDLDHHWERSLLFDEKFDSAPFIEIGATANFDVSTQVQLFAAANYEKYWEMRGDADYTITSTGEQGTTLGAAGADFRSFTLSGGLKVTF